MNRLKNFAKEVSDLNDRLRKEGKEALKEAFSEFFLMYPETSAIEWVQEFPAYNDGDPPRFSVSEFKLIPNLSSDLITEDVKMLMSYDRDDDGNLHFSACLAARLQQIDVFYQKNQALNDDYIPWHIEKSGVKQRELSIREQQLVKDFEELENTCLSIESTLMMVFGENVSVRATRERFEITTLDNY